LVDINLIKTIGTDYFKKSMFPPKKKVMKYDKHLLPIGIKKKTGKLYKVDLREALRIIAIGKIRSGKTFLMRSFADRVKKAGSNLFLPSDVKNEFQSSVKSVQAEFRGKLLEHEEPQPMDITSYRPTCFMDVKDKDRLRDEGHKPFVYSLPENNKWLSFNPTKFTKKDYLTLFNSENLTENAKTQLSIVYDYVRKHKREELGQGIKVFVDAIEEIDMFTEQQRKPLRQKFYGLDNSDFYVPKYEIDIVEQMQQGKAIALNMEDFDKFPKDVAGYPYAMFGALLRQVLDARRGKDKKLKNNLWVMVDEAPRFVPRDGKLAIRDDICESVDIDGAYGINYFFATQNLISMPEKIINQSRYVFVPYSITVPELKDILKNIGLLKSPHTAHRRAAEIKVKMDKYEWLVIDQNEGKMEIIKPLPPLSNHAKTMN